MYVSHSLSAQIPKIQKFNYDSVAAVIIEEMIEQEIMGLAVGIIKDEKVMQVKAYGHLDKNRKNPVTTEMVFRWASISKTVKAVAAYQEIAQNPIWNNKVIE